MKGMVVLHACGLDGSVCVEPEEMHADSLPDLDHPATLGCLRDMVSELYGRRAHYVFIVEGKEEQGYRSDGPRWFSSAELAAELYYRDGSECESEAWVLLMEVADKNYANVVYRNFHYELHSYVAVEPLRGYRYKVVRAGKGKVQVYMRPEGGDVWTEFRVASVDMPMSLSMVELFDYARRLVNTVADAREARATARSEGP
jgi:hypothetical protein